MLLFWVGKPLLRYLIPVLPLMLGGFVDIILDLAGAVRSTFRRTAALAALAVVCLAGGVFGFQVYVADLKEYTRGTSDERQAYTWIQGNLPTSAKFVANKEGVLYLYTGRQATSYQFLKRNIYTGSAGEWDQWREALPSFARERGLEYAFCDARSCPGAPTAAEMPKARAILSKSYNEIFRTGAVTVYKLKE
jgi:hypothetical protein